MSPILSSPKSGTMADEMLLNKFLLMPDNVCPQHRADSVRGELSLQDRGEWTLNKRHCPARKKCGL